MDNEHDNGHDEGMLLLQAEFTPQAVIKAQGFLSRDAEQRKSPNGYDLFSFSFAFGSSTNRQWVDCTAFGIVDKIMPKGTKVIIEGRPSTRGRILEEKNDDGSDKMFTALKVSVYKLAVFEDGEVIPVPIARTEAPPQGEKGVTAK